MMIIWRAVETASEIVAGVGMWECTHPGGEDVLGTPGWTFRGKFHHRKYNFFRGH